MDKRDARIFIGGAGEHFGEEMPDSLNNNDGYLLKKKEKELQEVEKAIINNEYLRKNPKGLPSGRVKQLPGEMARLEERKARIEDEINRIKEKLSVSFNERNLNQKQKINNANLINSSGGRQTTEDEKGIKFMERENLSPERLFDLKIEEQRDDIKKTAEKETGVKAELEADQVKTLREELKSMRAEKYMELAKAYLKKPEVKNDPEVKKKLQAMGGVDVEDMEGPYAINIVESLGALDEMEKNEEYRNLFILEQKLEKEGKNLLIPTRAAILSELNIRYNGLEERIEGMEEYLRDASLSKEERAAKTADYKNTLKKTESLFKTRTELAQKIDSKNLTGKAHNRIKGQLIDEDEYISQKWGIGEQNVLYRQEWADIISFEDLKVLNKMGVNVSGAEKTGSLFWKNKVLKHITPTGAEMIKGEEQINNFIENAKKEYANKMENLKKEYKVYYEENLKQGKDAIMESMVSESGSQEIKNYYDNLKEELITEFMKENIEQKKKKQLESIEGKGGLKIVDVLDKDAALFGKRMEEMNEEDYGKGFDFLFDAGWLRAPAGVEKNAIVESMSKYEGWTAGKNKTFIERIIDFLTDKKGGFSSFFPKGKK